MEANDNSKLQRWIPLESNCGVFTSYFQGIGLSKEFCFEELLTFDYKDIQSNINQQTEGVIVICQKIKPNNMIYNENDFDSEQNVPFYMIQNDSLTNACGLVAGLQCIGNLDHKYIESGSLLSNFLIQKKSSEEYAIGLSNNSDWKKYHCKIAIKGNSIIPENPKDVIHHFVTFVYNPKDSFIYELDGRLTKPYRHMKIKDKESLLDNVIEIINKRLETDLIMSTIAILLLLRKAKTKNNKCKS